jgi:hypothetical protein
MQDKLARRAKKHRDKYTGENKPHLEGVETITGTGETDQGVTLRNASGALFNCSTNQNHKYNIV